MVCNQVLPYVVRMHVDEMGEHQLTNFYGIRHKGKVTETDHAKVEMDVNLKFEVQKPSRKEAFNFKSSECQKYFKEITSSTQKLSSCFLSNEPFNKQIKKWEHEVKTHMIRAFPKIRSTKRKFSDTEAGKLFDERKRLKIMIEKEPSEENNAKLEVIEDNIADKIAERYRSDIENTMGHLTAEDGGINHLGVWKAKSAVMSSDKQNTPIALKDGKGNFITNPEGIKNLCLQEILKRLRHRDIRPDLTELKSLEDRGFLFLQDW